MQKTAIWISYDLGIKGDYPTFYKWLDSMKASECGNNTAYMHFEYQQNLLDELKASLLNTGIRFNPTDRIYVIYDNNATIKNATGATGKFIVGGRKLPQWKGYSQSAEQTVDVS